jgi:hypothetical protein
MVLPRNLDANFVLTANACLHEDVCVGDGMYSHTHTGHLGLVHALYTVVFERFFTHRRPPCRSADSTMSMLWVTPSNHGCRRWLVIMGTPALLASARQWSGR